MLSLMIEDGVKVLTIDRVDVHNCVDGKTAVRIAEEITEFAENSDLRVLVVTGAGTKSFCTGADLKAGDLIGHEWTVRAGPMGFAKLDPGKPTIAAINGYCFAGGMELAAWCDFRIASTNAEFGSLNRRWGVPFVDGGTQRFARIMGTGNANYLIQTGIRFGAERAQQLGFIQEITAEGEALNRALEIARTIASYPQESIVADRSNLIEGFGIPLVDGLILESERGFATLNSAEMLHGLSEFVSGNRPDSLR